MSKASDIMNQIMNQARKPAPTWPPTDADRGPGRIYDDNTEEGKRAYERAFLANEPSRHTNPGEYTPTLMGYTWMTMADYPTPALDWAATEIDRWIHVGRGDGTKQMTLDNWAARRDEFVVELAKRGITWVAPTYTKDSATLPPSPPHDPSRGR